MCEDEDIASFECGTRNVCRGLTRFFGLLLYHDVDNLTLEEDRLGSSDGLLRDPLLCKEQLFRLKLECQILSYDVDGVTLGQNVFKLV